MNAPVPSIHGLELDSCDRGRSWWSSTVTSYGLTHLDSGEWLVTLPMGSGVGGTPESALSAAKELQRYQISESWVMIECRRYPLDTARQRARAASALAEAGLVSARVSPGRERVFYSDGLFGLSND